MTADIAVGPLTPGVAQRPPDGPTVVPARALALCVLLVLTIASAAGMTSGALFTDQSTFKQGVTVAIPVALIGVLLSRRPLLMLTGAAIVAAPIDLVVTVSGISVSPLDAVLAVAWPAAYFSSRSAPRPRTSLVGRTAVVAAVAATLPLVNSHSGGEFTHLFIVVGLVGYLTARSARAPDGRAFLVRALVVSATVQALAALYEIHTKTLLDLYSASGSTRPDSNYFFSYETTFRPAGTMADPISLGNVLSAGLVLAIAAVLGSRTLRARLVWAACGVAIALALIFSLSRLSWIGALVGTAVLLLSIPRQKALLTLAGIVAGALLVIGIAFAADGKALIDRYHSISNPTSSTYSTAQGDKTRLELWKAAMGVAAANPVDGIGFGNIANALYGKAEGATIGTHAHSTYLNVLAEGGAIGAGALLLLIGATLSDGLAQLKRHSVLAAGVLGAFVAFLVDWTTDYTVRNVSVAALIAAVIGLAAMPDRKRRPVRVG